ncbi:MAG: hypothetical protein COV48_00470 [Elusimicrobia bacterium CG11_big_fil_rev_8_21_14_0_20_64_6]|nr:MAG: hypothetical protein COV48_00470 [Elusimicrobia bacterium CG11_big_fil_rev_8_21_14_0_20_64_6]
MRPLLSRSLCLAVLLVFPAGAGVVGPAPLAPALGMVQSVPAFQASVLEQVQLLSSLSGQPAAALSLSPLTAVIAAPTPASDPWRAEAARLVTALVAQPQALSLHKKEIRAAVGDQAYERLTKSAGRLAVKARANPALQEQLAGVRRELDIENPAAVLELGARLDALFENSRSMPGAPAVSAGDGAAKKPLVSLSRAGETPVMAPAELEAYVGVNAVVTPRGMKRVNFASGDYKPEYDAALRKLGVDLVVIKTPTRAELAKFKEEDGYHFKSEYQRWVMTTRTLEEHKVALGKSQRVRQFENQLAASEKIPTELVPLTAEKYEQWYPIYEEEVVGKPGGKRNVGLDFARKQAEQGTLDGWYGLFYYDPVDKTKIVGGVIMKAWPERGMFVLGYAAYRPRLKDISPSVRTFAESMKLAKSLGFPVLSFGQDTNFFGYDYSLGLMSNKAGFLLTPYPEDELVLLKVLDASKPASVKNAQGKSGGYFFFGIKRDSPVVERYLQSKDAGAPKEAQDLLGSTQYFDGKVVAAKDAVVGWHYKGDDPNPLRVPVGIDVIDR